MSANYSIYEKHRDDKGLSNADVIRITGISASTFSDWKSGRSKPKLEKLVKISSCLGVTIEDLISEEGRKA